MIPLIKMVLKRRDATSGSYRLKVEHRSISIKKAKEKASKANVECYFMVVDFLENIIEGAPFDFVFDRGCFHSFSSANDRRMLNKCVS